MKGTAPILLCSADDGACDGWTLDYYEMTASTVDGVRVTTTERSPGWTSHSDASDLDFCPRHAPAKKAKP